MTFPDNMPTGARGHRCKTGQGKLRVSYLSNAMLIRELIDGPCTARDLSQATGLAFRTVSNYLMAMHRKGCIRITAWERDQSGKQSIRAFGFGEGVDAEKEPRKRAGQKTRDGEARARLKIIERLAA